MTEEYKHPYMKRMEEGLRIDREATESFIKDSDTVRTEGKMSNITYTAEIRRFDDICIACDEHIEKGHLYIIKRNRERPSSYCYCVECACRDIKGREEAGHKDTDFCIYVTEEVAIDSYLTELEADTLLHWADSKFISTKHIISECESRYIDKYTTAYNSDIMRAIMSHE